MTTDRHDLHDLLDRALADLPVPADRIRDGALARGRSVRRRRRAAGLLGAAAVTVLVAGVALPSIAGSDDASRRIAHDTSVPEDLYEPPPGWWDMPGRVMRNRLGGLLPQGYTVTGTNLGNEDRALGEDPRGGWLQVDVAQAGSPAGGLNLVLYAPQRDGGSFVDERTACPGNLEAPDACTELRDPDGQVVGRTSRWQEGGVVVLEVTRLLPDGGMVYAAASNSPDDKWGAESATDRAEPAVTAAELRSIVQDPTWQAWTGRR